MKVKPTNVIQLTTAMIIITNCYLRIVWILNDDNYLLPVSILAGMH